MPVLIWLLHSSVKNKINAATTLCSKRETENFLGIKLWNMKLIMTLYITLLQGNYYWHLKTICTSSNGKKKLYQEFLVKFNILKKKMILEDKN